MKFSPSWMVAAFFLLMSIGTSFAAPVDLGAVMKNMGRTLTRIVDQSTDTSKFEETAGLCDTLLADIETSRTVMPDRVADLPVEQQEEQMARYRGMLDQLHGAVVQLKSDFASGNSAAISEDLAAIKQNKVTGHKAFKH